MKRLLLAVCLTVMMMFVAALGVQADVYTDITYNITSDHMTDGAGTAPFGTVKLVRDGTSVDFTVTLFDGSKFVRTGANGGYNFVFNATDVALADITGAGISKGGTPGSYTIHADGTGDWMFGVYYTGQDNGGGAGLPGPLEFSVANATISEVNLPSPTYGYIFAIDILSGQTGFTGLVDVSTPPRVPEASALVLLCTGLAGLVVWRRKKRFK